MRSMAHAGVTKVSRLPENKSSASPRLILKNAAAGRPFGRYKSATAGLRHKRLKRLKPQLQERFEMLFRLSLCFALAVVGQEVAMRQARLPRPQVSGERDPPNHDASNQGRLGI
jgi:hypothetical protein